MKKANGHVLSFITGSGGTLEKGAHHPDILICYSVSLFTYILVDEKIVQKSFLQHVMSYPLLFCYMLSPKLCIKKKHSPCSPICPYTLCPFGDCITNLGVPPSDAD